MREQNDQVQGIVNGSGVHRHFTEKVLLPWQGKSTLVRSSLAMLFFVILCFAAFMSTRLLDPSVNQKSIFSGLTFYKYPQDTGKKLHRNRTQIPLNCSHGNATKFCPANYYPSKYSIQDLYQNSEEDPISPQPTCPDYFRWIYEDLWPWRETGITREMVEAAAANKAATFRLVILNGKAYVQRFRGAFQTRDVFSKYSFLQLLRRYPGQLPDLDLIFSCADRPSIVKEFYPNPSGTAPPPLFGYDGDDFTLDIVFPDWSFWGWPEINIKPWKPLLKDLKEGNERIKWEDREPYAFWKGNPRVAPGRMDLFKCNLSDKHDWNVRVYSQDWGRAQHEGFKNSNLARQCTHRYKIYIEGIGWSVSGKYILACNSLTLLVKNRYYDFFTRSLMPLQHYWPIRDDNKCRSLKYAVDWGNSHQQEAQAIGNASSKFIQEELNMTYVYDYMFHLLTQYAKLLTYKPTVPPNAVELCSESMACPAGGLVKKYMMDSLAEPSDVPPCTMPPPYDPATLRSHFQRKENSTMQVQTWEKQYWDNQNKHS